MMVGREVLRGTAVKAFIPGDAAKMYKWIK